jgi:hypothetical protein
MTGSREISHDELREEISPWLPSGIDSDEALAGVALALVPPSQRTLPIVRNPFQSGVLYAWSTDDASATKLALKLLSQLGQGLLAEPTGLINLGLAIKEVICFLIDLKRHSVQVVDPLQIKVLMLLRNSDSGLSAQQLSYRFGGSSPPSLSEIDNALDALVRAEADGRPKPLVRVDRMIWKSLV